jgi:hypothetical protein
VRPQFQAPVPPKKKKKKTGNTVKKELDLEKEEFEGQHQFDRGKWKMTSLHGQFGHWKTRFCVMEHELQTVP